MGVISDTIQQERDAQGRPDSENDDEQQADGSTADGSPSVAPEADPFIQRYLTDEYTVESDKVDEMLSFAIALGNLL